MAFKLKYKNSAFPFKTGIPESEPKPITLAEQEQIKKLEESLKTEEKEKKNVETYISKRGQKENIINIEGGGSVKAPRGGSFSTHVQTEIDKRTGKTIIRPDFKYTNPKGWSIGVNQSGINIGKTFKL